MNGTLLPRGNRTEVYLKLLVRRRDLLTVWSGHATCHRPGEKRYCLLHRFYRYLIPIELSSAETKGYLKAVVDAENDRMLGGLPILASEGREVMGVIQGVGLPYIALRHMIFAHPTMAESLNDLFASGMNCYGLFS